MSHWSAACCGGEEPVLYFNPCPNSPDCSEAFVATASDWAEILGTTPSVGDVYKYDSGTRPSCAYCGKFQTETVVATAPPLGGFNSESSCDSVNCPVVYLYFNPCDDDVCGAYSMAATPTMWETLLSLPADSIDADVPSTYAGVWLFERTDGKICCENNTLTPCFKFCGQLSATGSTTGLCYDGQGPAPLRCDGCNVAPNQVQLILNSSGLSFTSKSGCDDDDCPKVCETQPAPPDQWIKVEGTKIYDAEFLISGDATWETGSPRSRVTMPNACESKAILTTTIKYRHYLKVNSTTWDGESSVPDWNRIYSGHCKEQCSEVISANTSGPVTAFWRFEAESLGSHDSYFEQTSFNGEFKLVDYSDVLEFAKLEKRVGLYENGIKDSCSPAGSHVQLCAGEIPTTGCVMNWLNETSARLQIVGTGALSNSFDSDSWTSAGPTFIQKMSTAQVDQQAEVLCCPTDTPLFDGMYWTNANEMLTITSFIEDRISPGSNVDSLFFNEHRPYNFLLHFCDSETVPGTSDPSSIFGDNACFELGTQGDTAYLDPISKSMDAACNNVNSNSWRFLFDQTTTTPPTTEIVDSGGTFSRRLKVDVAIFDTIESIECVDGPPTPCDDGVLDVP